MNSWAIRTRTRYNVINAIKHTYYYNIGVLCVARARVSFGFFSFSTAQSVAAVAPLRENPLTAKTINLVSHLCVISSLVGVYSRCTSDRTYKSQTLSTAAAGSRSRRDSAWARRWICKLTTRRRGFANFQHVIRTGIQYYVRSFQLLSSCVVRKHVCAYLYI